MLNKKQFKEANSLLLFRSMAEVMLDLYGNLRALKNYFDPWTLQMWKNLMPILERGSKKIHRQLIEEEIKILYHFTNAIEYLVDCTDDPDRLYEISSLILSHQKKEITIINTTEELIAYAEEKKEVVNG